jgi:hypothetical protein
VGSTNADHFHHDAGVAIAARAGGGVAAQFSAYVHRIGRDVVREPVIAGDRRPLREVHG